MRVASFSAVALTVVAVMVAGAGCKQVQRYEPSVPELAALAQGARVVILPVKAEMHYVERTSRQAMEEEYVAVRTYASLHRAFSQAGYDVVPLSEVEPLRRGGAAAMLVPYGSHFYPILYYHLNVDYVVTAKVEILAGEVKRTSEVVTLHIYDARGSMPIRIYRWWRTVPARMAERVETKPPGAKM